jgi:hypothetical protein
MIDNAIKEYIPFSYVTMDGFYRENPILLTELENRSLTFVADIAIDTKVYVQEPIVGIPEKKGNRGKQPTIPKVLNLSSIRVDSLSFCNASENASFEELAKMQSSRYWVERAFQDAKGYCGMAEYMVRSWNSWHHHMALVMLAMLILLS